MEGFWPRLLDRISTLSKAIQLRRATAKSQIRELSMTLRSRWDRTLRVVVVALLALVAGLALFVQIEQRILRSRAERLLADMREMQSHPGTWADAQKIMQRWRPWGLGESYCSPEECFFYVRMVDPVNALLLGNDDGHPKRHWLIWPAQLLGEKFTFIEASLRVNHGIIEESRFRMNFWGQDEGIAIAVDDLSALDYMTERWQHPDYYAEKHPWCVGCVRFETGFTPFAGPDKIRELTDFNFSCVTRWLSCTTEEDVMPSAWRLYQEELPHKEAQRKAFEECKVPPEVFGLENHTIAIADVISVQGPIKTEDWTAWSARLKIIRSLKGRVPWPQSKILRVSNEGQNEDLYSWHGVPKIASGGRYILFGYLTEDQTGRAVLDLDECGVIPYNEQNLSAFQRGIDAALARHIPQRLGVDSIWP
jgi:hypothetical protein